MVSTSYHIETEYRNAVENHYLWLQVASQLWLLDWWTSLRTQFDLPQSIFWEVLTICPQRNVSTETSM